MPRYTFTITPEHPEGQFRPDSFDHLMQMQVHAPGLDSGFRHTLIDAQVEPGGAAATLTLHTEPVARTRQLRGAFRVVAGTPTARVVCVNHEDPSQELLRVQLDAPLQAGQRVALGEQEYMVTGADNPGRNPETGVCSGDIDWQRVFLAPVAPISDIPQLNAVPIHHHETLRRPPVLPPAG